MESLGGHSRDTKTLVASKGLEETKGGGKGARDKGRETQPKEIGGKKHPSKKVKKRLGWRQKHGGKDSPFVAPITLAASWQGW